MSPKHKKAPEQTDGWEKDWSVTVQWWVNTRNERMKCCMWQNCLLRCSSGVFERVKPNSGMSWECWQTESEQLFSSLWMESQDWACKVMTLELSLLLGSAAESWEVMQCYQEVLCKGSANAFLSQEGYFYLFLAHPWVQQDSLWEDTQREKPHPEGHMQREKDTSPNSLFWLLVFVVRFGLVVWWFVFFFPLLFVLLLWWKFQWLFNLAVHKAPWD